jgi:hypothetical protein
MPSRRKIHESNAVTTVRERDGALRHASSFTRVPVP